jgi:hypothetical protein
MVRLWSVAEAQSLDLNSNRFVDLELINEGHPQAPSH